MRLLTLTIGLTFCVLSGASAHATMPTLTERPNPASPTTCREWAAAQDSEALEMWGIQEDGKFSQSVGINRLASFCMGQPQPEIVGFGSSEGFDREYCYKHKEQDLCIRLKPENGQTRVRPHVIRGCFVRDYDKGHLAQHSDQTVTSVKLKIYPSPTDVDADWFMLRVQRRGEHHALHGQGYCKQEHSETKCFVECDGGGVTVVERSESAILMGLGVQSLLNSSGKAVRQDERIRMSACGGEDVDNGSGIELTAGNDDREFLLKRAAQEQCMGLDR
jgi:hypothetical protein